ncbi:MAG: N-acetylneuraminate synthase family protein, partial [Candidatus Omnitrophica bacterium]|nr:N-acetylneuraminate synthase family protein [Candidatus Omnitrophota bacterium]
DHTEPTQDMLELVTAVLLGSCVIEKHFTLDKSLPGNDHYHAMDPADLRTFFNQMERVRELYGSRQKSCLESELNSVKFARRSIVTARAIPAGELISGDDLIMKRPGTGIPPTDLDKVIGARTSVTLEEDTILQWEHLSLESSNPK